MDDKTKELFAKQKEAEVREHEAKLRRLDAEARARKAQDAIEEVSGLRALHDRIKEQVNQFKSSAAARADQARSDIETSWDGFQRRFKEAQKKYWAIDDARLEKLNARLDQFDASVDQLEAQGKQDMTGEAIAIRGAMADLQTKLAAAREKRRRVSEARDEAAVEVAIAYEEAMDDLDSAYERASQKVDAARASSGSQPPA
ncbi:MAG: hypothetical protein HY901_27290 [Deltaproteobacteria bacterium]|nr:hypothetical protein [Deltaproteobacteria bacterium]